MIAKADIERIEFNATVATGFLNRQSPYAELGADCLRLIDELYNLNMHIKKCKVCRKHAIILPKREE